VRREKQLRGLGSLIGGVLFAPLGFLLSLQANYLVVRWACAYGWMILLYVVSSAALVISAGGMLLSLRNWMAAGQHWPVDTFGILSRNRFLAVLGLLMSGLFLILVVAQTIPIFILNPCQR
jgi:hypothetical protein